MSSSPHHVVLWLGELRVVAPAHVRPEVDARVLVVFGVVHQQGGVDGHHVAWVGQLHLISNHN